MVVLTGLLRMAFVYWDLDRDDGSLAWRTYHLGYYCHVVTSHHVSLVPQPLHTIAYACRFPWSRWSDRIFRNEVVTD